MYYQTVTLRVRSKCYKVVIGENHTFKGPEAYLQSRGVTLKNQYKAECKTLMQNFIAAKPQLWFEDIGE